ncbi:hypothetical protein DFR36_10260 [Melaminivora alkalimesophila]|uniref:Uncharacterized protein n=3 Tax=Melaminivora alkalimesophila TaxID=1165852 RepID=A0A317RF28_9BURK|nr:hypothetical protein [Melaminivora alkalimesophila]PWW47687.1 hypothetical protein DFR36_10260 [Melaminivora alkalimesophila]
MRRPWTELLPLVRPAAALLLAVVLVLALAASALWGVRLYLSPQWQQAQGERQSAQAALEEAHAEQADAAAHLPHYRQMQASGFIGGEPRAAWVEDLLAAATHLGLRERLSFQLAPPETVAMELAQEAQVQVQRHVLQVELQQVHEIEALRLLQGLLAQHPQVARLAGCSFEQPGAEGLTVRCRVNFLHIAPLPAQANNADQ